MEPGGGVPLVTALRRATLEYCVLALLRDRARYAVELVRTLSSSQVLATGEGTLYPLLGRLRRAGVVTSSWQESPNGPPRRYYELTSAGREELKAFEQEWWAVRDAVDATLRGDLG